MENYLVINGKRIELTFEQVAQLTTEAKTTCRQLFSVAVADTVKIGVHELVVLEQTGTATVLIRKDLLGEDMEFGENNNYAGSNVESACNAFAKDISGAVGEDNMLTYTLDLTSDDGLKDYGAVECQSSPLTADLYRKYVQTLDKHKIDSYWWLATPHSTETHKNAEWVKCVSPSGNIRYGNFLSDRGVRPFCILKSNIFVSEEA